MRKLTQAFILTLAIAAAIGSLSTAIYTYTLSERLEQVARTSRADLNYLRGCIRGLEAELTSSIIDRLEAISRPVGGVADAETEADTEAESGFEAETVFETEVESAVESSGDGFGEIPEWEIAETEAVTLPVHREPETVGSEESETVMVVYYTISAHEGCIGVFDAEGELIRRVNVFLFALPEADREALLVGIPAYSREEMLEIVARYE